MQKLKESSKNTPAMQNTYFDQHFRYLETINTSVISNHKFFKIIAK